MGDDPIENRLPKVEIDLNVRVRDNQTFVLISDFSEDVKDGDEVMVFESESGLEGMGFITSIEDSIVYIRVPWRELRHHN